MSKLLAFTQSTFYPASRFRVMQYIPYLEQNGWQVTHCPNRPDRQWQSSFKNRIFRGLHYRAGRQFMKLNRWRDIQKAKHFDVIFQNRNLMGIHPFFEQALYHSNPKIIFDFDDAIFLGKNEKTIRWICEHAAWVTPGNQYLAEFASQYTDRITIIPTVVNTTEYLQYDRNIHANMPVRVGWIGSLSSFTHSLQPFLPLIAAIQEKIDFEFVIVTNPKPDITQSNLKWRFEQWSPTLETQIAKLYDIGIMPLVDNEFQRGKCGAKLLQYMAASIPAVVSPVGVNGQIVKHGETGFHALSEQDWEDVLSMLVHDASIRQRVGQAGQTYCEAEYSVKRWAPVLSQILNQVKEE